MFYSRLTQSVFSLAELYYDISIIIRNLLLILFLILKSIKIKTNIVIYFCLGYAILGLYKNLYFYV